MRTFDLLNAVTSSFYPGHIIIVGGDAVRITGQVAVKGQPDLGIAEPLESAIHMALLVRQRDALHIGVVDDQGLWPERLGTLAHWNP